MGVSFVQELIVDVWIHGGDGPTRIDYSFELVPEDEENRKILTEGIDSVVNNFLYPATVRALYYTRYRIEDLFRFLQQEPRFDKMRCSVKQPPPIQGRLFRRISEKRIEWSPSKEERVKRRKLIRQRRQERKYLQRKWRGHPGYTITPCKSYATQFIW